MIGKVMFFRTKQEAEKHDSTRTVGGYLGCMRRITLKGA